MSHTSISQPRFLANGQLVPFDPGDVLEGMEIQARRAHIDGYFYRVKMAQGEAVLYETPAYFQAAWQDKVWRAVTPSLCSQGLSGEGGPLQFQKTWQKITLNYVLYPEWVWEVLSQPLAARAWEVGVLDEAEIRQVYHWLREQQQLLTAQGWINPSLLLPNLFWGDDGELLCLESACAVPLNQELIYPRFFTGYHHGEKVDPITLAWQSAYATLLALLQGKSPRFWSPETIDLKTLHRLLTPELLAWFETWKAHKHPDEWPDLPAPLFRPEADLEAYRQSTRYFNLGFAAYQDKNIPVATHYAQLSAGLWSTDPWAHFLLARCADARSTSRADADFRRQQEEDALTHLNMALRILPLGVFWREKARLHFKLQQLADAEESIHRALEQSEQDDVAWHLCSVIMTQAQQWKKAERAIKNACQLRPLNSMYRQQWIQILQRLGAHQQAQRLYCFAAGESARITQAFSRSDRALPDLQPPGHWEWDTAQTPTLEALAHGAPVKHGQSGDTGFIKYIDISDEVVRQDLRQQHEWLSALNANASVAPHLFLHVLTAEEQGAKMAVVYNRVPGENLQSQLARGPLPTSDWNALAAQGEQMLQALAREGLVHGDITPANLIWHNQQLTLVDYENLHRIEENRPRYRSLHTTPDYAAPEHWKTHQVSHSADRYSFALVLLQAASGVFPDLARHWKQQDFSGYRRHIGHLPGQIQTALLEATRWKPSARFTRSTLTFDSVAARREIPAHGLALALALQAVTESQTPEEFSAAQQALLRQEQSAMVYYHLAYHAERLGDDEKAQTYAQACLHLTPHHVGAHWILASVFMNQKRYPLVLKVLAQAQNHGPDEPETYRRLLQVYCLLGQLELALAACHHLERCLPHHAEVRLEKAMTLAHFGLDHQAAEVLASLPIHLQSQVLKEPVRFQ